MFFLSLFDLIFSAIWQNNARYFKDYQKDLPQLQLPYSIVCGVNSRGDSLLNPFLLKKFAPVSRTDVNVIGELFDGGSYVYILYSVKNNPADPWLYTYKNDGRKIDSLCLHHGFCYSDMDGEKTTSVNIDIDKSISITDSLVNYSFDSIQGKIPKLRIVSKSIYKPNNKKLFKLVSQRSDTLFAQKH